MTSLPDSKSKPIMCALETVRRFSLRASHHAYVALLQYRPRERRFDRVFVESVPRVWHNSTRYWTAWYFPASPGMVIEARLVGGRRDPKSYYRVTAASHWWQASPHLRRISRLQAHRYAIAHAKRLHRSWQRFRHLPAALKVQVWARDRGRCVRCGSTRDPLNARDFADQLGTNIFDQDTGKYLVNPEDWVAVGEDIMRRWGVDPTRELEDRHPSTYDYKLQVNIPTTNAEGQYIKYEYAEGLIRAKEVRTPEEASPLAITRNLAHLWRPPLWDQDGEKWCYYVDPADTAHRTGLLYLLPHLFSEYDFGATTVEEMVLEYANDIDFEWIKHVPDVYWESPD